MKYSFNKRHKFNAIKAEADGITFHSKKERDYYNLIKLKQQAGEVRMFLMQVPFRLPGGVKYLLDFMVFKSDGEIEFIEVKGFDTPIGKLKRQQVQELYEISIDVV